MPKTKRIRFFKAISPLSRPIADSTHAISEISFLVTQLETGDGIIGESFLLSFHYSPNAIAGALRDIRELALGWEISDTGRLALEFDRQSEYFGQAGVNRWALAALNLAMWDAWGKTLDTVASLRHLYTEPVRSSDA